MAALNQSETETLGEAITVLENVASQLKSIAIGEDFDRGRLRWLAAKATDARDRVKTVREMKGYYPK